MTTIAATLKEIAADTRVSWEGVGNDTYKSVKLYKTKYGLYGITGENCDGSITAIGWFMDGGIRPEPPKKADWRILELGETGLAIYNTYLERDSILDNCISLGSGRKVALYCMKVLGMSPAEAVREACKADSWSGLPIYSATLADKQIIKITKWR